MTGPRMRVALLVMGLVLWSLPALAATPEAVVDVRRDGDVLWAEATVGHGEADAVKVVFRAPRREGSGREVWQVCRFEYDGARVYRCGIDVSPGSAASRRSGEWKVKVRLDGEVAAAKTFSL